MNDKKFRPFNITILVSDGNPNGVRIVEKSNWVGRAVICPRNRYPEAKKERAEFSQSGVYLLVGKNENDAECIYIGESDNVVDRLNYHYTNKEFWQTAIVFTTTGEPLNKGKVKYLETKLLELAKRYKRCDIDNEQQTLQYPHLSEFDKADIDGYLMEMLSLFPVINVDIFTPISKGINTDKYASDDGVELTDKSIEKLQFSDKKQTMWNAMGYVSDKGFVVEKGSLARIKTVKSLDQPAHKKIKKQREYMQEKGVLIKSDKGNFLEFTEDWLFNKPSRAASVCSGSPANGLDVWKNKENKSLNEINKSEIEDN